MALDSRESESRRQRSDRRSTERDRRDEGRQSAEASSRRSRSRSRSHSRRGDRSRSPPSRRSHDDDQPDASRRQRGSKWDVSGGTAEKRSLSEAIVPAVPSSVPATLSPSLLSPFFEAAPANHGPPKQTVEIDQRFATYVIGSRCELMRPIEAATSALIRLDCSAGSQGPSICRVYGDEDVASIAADMIRIRLATADGSLPEAIVTEKVEIEHAHVFKILGKDGEAVKQLGIDTGASVTFQRGPITSESADFLHISGQKDRVGLAKRLVQKRLDDAMTISFGQETSNPPEASCGIPVEQQFIGWIMGKSKETIRQIADQSGAFIQVKQANSFREGHSIVKISGAHAAVSAARVRIQQRVDHGRKYQDDKKKQFIAGDWLCPQCGDQQFRRNDTCRRCNTTRPTVAADSERTGGEKGGGKHDTGAFLKRDSDTAFQVDQQYVGFIIGPGGTTFRDIKEVTGAKIFVDQEHRDQGFSIVRIGDAGTPENLMAQDIIEQKIEEGLERTQRMPLQADGNRNGVPATSVPHVTIVPPPQQPPPQRGAGGLLQIVLPPGWSPPAAPTGALGAASGGGQWSSGEWGGTNWNMHGAKQSMMDMYWDGASGVVDPSANSEESMAGATVPSAPLTTPEPALPALEEDDAIEILGPVIVEAVGLATREEQQGHFFKHLTPMRPRLTSELYDKIVASFEEALAE